MRRLRLCTLLVMVSASGFILPAAQSESVQPEAKPLSTAKPNSSTADKKNPGSDDPVLKVNSRLVLVDVVALDHKGRPVAGLKQDDFTVLENGKEEHLRVFSFQDSRDGSGPPSQPILKQATLPPNVVTNIPRSQGTGLLSVLLVDGINTRMNNQQYLKQQVLEFLKGLPSDQRMAVYLLGTRLHLLQDFTSDPEILKNVIAHLKDYRSPLMDNAAGGPQKFWFEGMPLPPEVKRRILEFQQETESKQVDQRVAITLEALNSLARSLAGYPGRKNLIWVSETFPLEIVPLKAPGESALNASRDYSSILAKTTNLLTDAQIAVYPIDARALVGTYVFDPSVQYDVRGDSIAALGKTGQLGRAMDDTSEELSAAHATMQEFAGQTGGRAFFNRNDIGNVIRQSVADGSAYYTLGYYPQNKSWDSHFRKIKVKVNRPGVTLRYRLGYFAFDPEGYAKRASCSATPTSPPPSIRTFQPRQRCILQQACCRHRSGPIKRR